jgi:hypothetical protein
MNWTFIYSKDADNITDSYIDFIRKNHNNIKNAFSFIDDVLSFIERQISYNPFSGYSLGENEYVITIELPESISLLQKFTEIQVFYSVDIDNKTIEILFYRFLTKNKTGI